jgi:hypothetical protein
VKKKSTPKKGDPPEIAFYYPNPFWNNGDWIKNLILFFDGIGILVPKYMKDQVTDSDPAIVAGLKKHGLLHIFQPEKMVNKAATERLATAMVDILASGVLDRLAKDKSKFAELSFSRLGSEGDAGLAAMIRDELIKRRLAKKSQDGVSIPMHPKVRSLILVLLSQILREPGRTLGFDLSPVTDMPQIVEALGEFLSLSQTPSSGHVVAFDLYVVGVDLGSVPIDEILDFRRENLEQHRKYARSVRLFVEHVSLLPAKARAFAFEQRQAELNDLASDLRKLSRGAWKRPASFALGMLGAAWTAAGKDLIAAALAATSVLLSASDAGKEKPNVRASSYIFNARAKYF